MKNKLLDPITIKNVTLRNRVVMAPMCMYSAKDGLVNDFHLHHYTARAMGGVGLIIIEAIAVQPQGRITENDLGIYDENQLEGLKKLVNSVHQYGAKIATQLAHAGRKAQLEGTLYGPSAIAYDENSKVPKEMDIKEIEETIQAFKQGASYAKECGFDIIEIHGAHGYLINEFLSPATNQRKDQYGGTPENRFRILKEIVQEVSTVFDGPIFVRISADEYTDQGNTLEDYIQISQWLEQLGVALIDVSTGGLVPKAPTPFVNYQVPYAKAIKDKTNLLVGAVGLITEKDQALEILTNNEADFIFLGRELLRHPNWVLQANHDFGFDYDGPIQ